MPQPPRFEGSILFNEGYEGPLRQIVSATNTRVLSWRPPSPIAIELTQDHPVEGPTVVAIEFDGIDIASGHSEDIEEYSGDTEEYENDSLEDTLFDDLRTMQPEEALDFYSAYEKTNNKALPGVSLSAAKISSTLPFTAGSELGMLKPRARQSHLASCLFDTPEFKTLAAENLCDFDNRQLIYAAFEAAHETAEKALQELLPNHEVCFDILPYFLSDDIKLKKYQTFFNIALNRWRAAPDIRINWGNFYATIYCYYCIANGDYLPGDQLARVIAKNEALDERRLYWFIHDTDKPIPDLPAEYVKPLPHSYIAHLLILMLKPTEYFPAPIRAKMIQTIFAACTGLENDVDVRQSIMKPLLRFFTQHPDNGPRNGPPGSSA